jgi:hypothetical protein
MAMRRGHHTSRVLKALGQANGIPDTKPKPKPAAKSKPKPEED